MKKIDRRSFLKICGTVGAAGALAACGGSSSSAPANNGGGAAEKPVVSLVMWGAEEDQAMLTEMSDAFCAKYADAAELSVQVGVQSESDCKDKVLTDATAAADVYCFPDDQLMDLVNAGALQEVMDVGEYVSLADVKERNMAAGLDACTMDGTLYAFPATASNGYFMFYDASVFTAEDVQTMDRMLEVAEAAGRKIGMEVSSGWYFASFFMGAGLTMKVGPDGVTNVCDWNCEKGVEVCQAIIDICKSPVFEDMPSGDFITGLKDGTCCAGVSGTWNAVVAEESWGANYAAVKLPTYTVAGEQVQMGSFSGFKMLGVNRHSANVGWAMALANFITNEENQTKRFEVRGEGPTNINAAASDAVQAAPAIVALGEQAAYATLQRVGGQYWTPAATLGKNLVDGNGDGDPAKLAAMLDEAVAGITSSVG